MIIGKDCVVDYTESLLSRAWSSIYRYILENLFDIAAGPLSMLNTQKSWPKRIVAWFYRKTGSHEADWDTDCSTIKIFKPIKDVVS